MITFRDCAIVRTLLVVTRETPLHINFETSYLGAFKDIVLHRYHGGA